MTTTPQRPRTPVRARRRAKNHWTYDCATCGYVHNSVDEFGAYEAGWHHVRSMSHLGQSMAKGFQAFADAFERIGNDILTALNRVR